MKASAHSIYDVAAPTFERYRPLPSHAVEAIRSTIWNVAHLPEEACVLDVGAGTGRIGKAFAAAGATYAGVDSSFAMLLEFSRKPAFEEWKTCLLAQADGRQLPFQNATFDVVLLMQVLTGTGSWREMLEECRRVLRAGGIVAVGHMATPEAGTDAQLRHRLRAILEEMQIVWHQPRESRKEALAWLESAAARHSHREVAFWNVSSSAEEFFMRHRTGARFAALPCSVQDEALRRLQAWLEMNPGMIKSNNVGERHSFELDIFEFQEGSGFVQK